jgi:actin-related protein
MKKLILAVTVLALSACSTSKLANTDMTEEGTKFAQDFGKVEVTFDDKGNWVSLKSSGTSFVPIAHDAGVEQAMNVAAMRAKRNIVEFIQTDLQSKKTTDTITKALAKDVSEDDVASKQRAANIATEIQEKITVESNGIVKGVYVVDRKVAGDGKNVVVIVQVDKRSMKAAKQIKTAFAQ